MTGRAHIELDAWGQVRCFFLEFCQEMGKAGLFYGGEGGEELLFVGLGPGDDFPEQVPARARG